MKVELFVNCFKTRTVEVPDDLSEDNRDLFLADSADNMLKDDSILYEWNNSEAYDEEDQEIWSVG